MWLSQVGSHWDTWHPCNLERRTAGVQYFLDYVDFNASFQSSTQLSNCAAYTSLLHFPAVQHLVHHLWQAVTEVVMFNGLYFHLGQTQSSRTTLPLESDVFSHQIQVLLNHSMVLWITREEMDQDDCMFDNILFQVLLCMLIYKL